ncbi:MAG: hypothetical protein IKJ76_03890 [Fibrobacter sp.]|nr:hypothetical protein [Fibrobacter sp.]
MKRFLLGCVLALSFSLLSCNDNSSSGPDKKEGGGIEVPCNAENEGEVVSPADSDKEYICKNSSWNVVDSSRHCEDCKDETIAISSSSSNNDVILSASDKSSSSIITSETKQSSSEQSIESSNSEVGDSSSSVETTEEESSSSEETEESSSSEETSMFLCDDGVTYVLDLENCEVESSSSEDARESSSSETATQSSSEKVEESSSSEEIVESSSSGINVVSSSSLNSVYDAENNTLTDLRDGQVYKTVVIGTQIWMAQNLNYLPEDTVGTIWAGKSVCGGGEWKSLEEGDCSIYGRLYESSFTFTSNAAYTNKICPDGWSLPTKKQYETLISFLGDKAIDKMKIQNSSYWNISESITSSGFAAIPAGYYTPYGGFNDQENVEKSVAYFGFIYNSKNIIAIIEDRTDFRWTTFGTAYYMSIRCIKKN